MATRFRKSKGNVETEYCGWVQILFVNIDSQRLKRWIEDKQESINISGFRNSY